MNRKDFDLMVNDTIAKTAALLIAKGAEYAGDADRMSNFKNNAAKQGVTPLQIWKQYYGKHIDSIDTYFSRVHDAAIKLALDRAAEHFRTAHENMDAKMFRAHVNNCMPQAMEEVNATLSEPIEGRFHDIINYCFLGLALLKDTRDNS